MMTQISNVFLWLFLENCLAQGAARIINIMLILNLDMSFVRVGSTLADRT